MNNHKELDTIEKLVAFLTKANIAYRNTSKPIITDEEYDLLEERLREMAPNHPFLSKIGAVPNESKIKLPYWMGSLDKIRDNAAAIDKWKNNFKGSVLVSDKLDGNSGMICYKDGIETLYSRGNGKIGQNISHLIPFLNFPRITSKNIAIRGEIIISKENWEIIHAAHPEYSNARNLVAGILHSKAPDKNIAKYIEFVAYELIEPKMTASKSIEYIENLGFKTVYTLLLSNNELTVDKLSDILIQRRSNSPYDIDGIVVTDDTYVHKLISGKNPAYSFAFKSMLTHTEAEVIVKEVVWNISKDGYYKPTVTFDQITLAGVNIQKATGFNAGFIEKNKIGPGTRLIIIRSGDVIPHILRVISGTETGASFPPDNKWEWNESHIDIMVVRENEMTKEQKLKTLEHFAKTLEIKFVAKGVISKLIDAGFDTIPKFFKVKSEYLLKIEGFKKTSADKIAKSINDAYESATCVNMMAASNIFGRGFGTKKLAGIIKELPEILNQKMPTLAQLIEIEGIAEITAKGFLEGMPRFFALMREIPMDCRGEKKHSSPIQQVAARNNTINFKDAKVVFTGFRDKKLEEIIESHGGKIATSISKNVTLVIAADINEISTKLEKAKELKIKIISKEELSRIYGA